MHLCPHVKSVVLKCLCGPVVFVCSVSAVRLRCVFASDASRIGAEDGRDPVKKLAIADRVSGQSPSHRGSLKLIEPNLHDCFD